MTNESLLEFMDSLDDVDPLELSNTILMPNYGPAAICLVKGEGAKVLDSTGRWYYDFLSGIAVASLGHANPAVAEAVSWQAQELMHVSNIFANLIGPKVAAMIDRLIRLERLSSGPGRVFFANSGAEANEAAIKLARKYGLESGKHHIITALGSFHGRTMGALSATGQRSKQIPFEPLLPGFSHVPWNDVAAIESAVTEATVAVMLEPIQGEAGVIDPDETYLGEVQQLCRSRDLLLIIDEVQTGFARTGKWFGFQHYSIEPDIVTMAKALGSGMPISACWAREGLSEAFAPGDHGTTFGGQPLAASAALATIRKLIEIDAPARSQELGEAMLKMYEGNADIDSISGSGLLRGINLKSPSAKKVALRAMELGVIVNPIGEKVIRLAPPLIISLPELESACQLILQAISEVE
ncbi:MAG: acetylornithine/succinylornithine family transaminase [Actinobacteria bacterium]|nr:acetylornithine/succinylornithine family transaminase [Actinomycetota bacterium]